MPRKEDEPMQEITIVLKIRGAGDAYHVVNELLDQGVLQEAINHHECDTGPISVASATVVIP